MPQNPPSDLSDDEFNSPVTGRRLDRIFRVVGLTAGSRVLDIGCGNGEALIRAHEQFGASGVGVDLDAAAIRKASEKASTRAPSGAIAFHVIDIAHFTTDQRFDLVLCNGSCHARGGFRPSLETMKQFARPGGFLLIGDIYWKKDPDDAYLAHLGEQRADHLDHAGTAAIGAECGLSLIYTAVSSDEEWDHFEGRFWAARLKRDPAKADEPEQAARRDRMVRWRDAYLRWGRETMGFCLYLFQT